MPMVKKDSKSKSTETGEAVRSIPRANFTVEEQMDDDKQIITIFGGKGIGKTTMAMQFPDSIAAISLDRKTQRIAKQYPDRNIRTFDGRAYFIYDKDNFTKSSSNTLEYLHAILDKLDSNEDERPDWILLDAMEYMIMFCEGKMRHDNRIGPFEAFGKNPALWRERNTNFRMWHDHALNVARRGLIYTGYYAFESGENSVYKVPKWTDVVQSETDIVIHCVAREDESEEGGMLHEASVISSKTPLFLKTGAKYDMHENNFKRDLEEYYKAKP